MQILLDDEPCLAGITSIGDAIDGAARLAEQHGRVVVEVIVDGVAWNETELHSPDSRSGTAGLVAFVSTDLQRLIAETLDGSSEALVHADRLHHEAAELIQADDQAAAMPKLGEALAIWQNIQAAVTQSAAALEIDLGQATIDDRPFTATAARLGDQLRTLRTGLQEKDPVILADTLLYELPDVVTEWRAILHWLRERVGE